MNIILDMIKRVIKKNMINIFKISYKILNIISVIYFLFNIIELINISNGVNIKEKYKGECNINLPIMIDLIDKNYYYRVKCNFKLENIINQTCYLPLVPLAYLTIDILNQEKYTESTFGILDNCFLCNKDTYILNKKIMATELKLLEAMAALTAQLKRIADVIERDQKKSIIEMRKEQLNRDKNELLSNIRS